MVAAGCHAAVPAGQGLLILKLFNCGNQVFALLSIDNETGSEKEEEEEEEEEEEGEERRRRRRRRRRKRASLAQQPPRQLSV